MMLKYKNPFLKGKKQREPSACSSYRKNQKHCSFAAALFLALALPASICGCGRSAAVTESISSGSDFEALVSEAEILEGKDPDGKDPAEEFPAEDPSAENSESVPDKPTSPETEAAEMIAPDYGESLVIELDPGHGDSKIGCENVTYGVYEKDLNLQIAGYLREELLEYENVVVCMTKEDDSNPTLEERVAMAVEDDADVLISIHNNAYGTICDYADGCTVLAARGVYEEALSQLTQELSCCILEELTKVGSTNRGILLRVIDDGRTYPNGALMDYYNLVRNCLMEGIPGIIIEHGFVDNDEDFEKLFSSEEKLRALAKADADGIAAYYRLTRKDGGDTPARPADCTEMLVTVHTRYAEDNSYEYKTFFTSE